MTTSALRSAPGVRLALRVILLGLAYAGLSLTVTVVTTFGGSSGTTFWPAAGVTVAVLLRSRRDHWSWLLGAVWVAEFILNFWVSHIPFAVSAGWATANSIEPLVGAALVTWGGRDRPNLSRVPDLLRFGIVAVLVAPAVGATIGAGTATLAGFYSLWPAVGRWFVGDALGVVALAPLVLTIGTRSEARRTSPGRGAFLLLVVLAGSGLAMLPWRLPWDGAFPYLVVPTLVVVALKASLQWTAAGVAIVAVMVNGITAAGHGPFVADDPIGGLIEAQAFLAMTVFAALVAGALTADLVGREEVDRTKTAFLQAVAHDMRTPLGVAGGFAELLVEHGDRMRADERRDLAERIRDTTVRMAHLVEDVLENERLAAGMVGVQREPLEIGQVIDDAIGRLQKNGHPIHSDSNRVVAFADRTAVERILENLLQNALRHTPDGTDVWVRAANAGDGTLIVVEDAGPGVSAEDRERIFAPFTGERARGGSGVGLSLVARFAELHGGRAWVEERPGGGASFRVFLPS